MSDIQQQIAAILRSADAFGGPQNLSSKQLAEVLVSELGLTQEWTGGAKTRRAGFIRAATYETSLASRYVTEWVTDALASSGDNESEEN